MVDEESPKRGGSLTVANLDSAGRRHGTRIPKLPGVVSHLLTLLARRTQTPKGTTFHMSTAEREAA